MGGDKMRFTFFAFALISGALGTGCGTNIPSAKFYHAQHGVVASDDPRLVAVRQACGKTAYAQGITIDGKLVTDRDTALNAWSRFWVDQVMPPGAGAIAGTQGALAVSTGNPGYATQHTPSGKPQFKRPAYSDRLDQLEKETWNCVEKNGWTNQKKT